MNFFNYVIISSLIKCEKQPDNGSDRYAAKCKHRLGSEHTFKHTAEFLQSSFYWPRVAAWALILHASNETQRINDWLLFLIAITNLLDKEHVFRPLHFLQNLFCKFAEVIARGLANKLTDLRSPG